MFIQYFGEVNRPFREVDEALVGALGNLQVWAEESYREGESIRAKIGPVGGGVAKTVLVETGEPRRSEDLTRIPLEWEATGTPGFFPRMNAELVVSAIGADLTQVKLQGNYDPPFGSLGRAVDRALLHRVAETSVKNLVDHLTEALAVPSD